MDERRLVALTALGDVEAEREHERHLLRRLSGYESAREVKLTREHDRLARMAIRHYDRSLRSMTKRWCRYSDGYLNPGTPRALATGPDDWLDRLSGKTTVEIGGQLVVESYCYHWSDPGPLYYVRVQFHCLDGRLWATAFRHDQSPDLEHRVTLRNSR